MEWVETTGKTVAEAKDAALDQLGVAADEAEFKVVEEAKTGLFGRTRREARVRARVRPAPARAKVDRRRERGRSRGPKQGRGGKGGKQGRGGEGPKQGRGGKGPKQGRGGAAGGDDKGAEKGSGNGRAGRREGDRSGEGAGRKAEAQSAEKRQTGKKRQRSPAKTSRQSTEQGPDSGRTEKEQQVSEPVTLDEQAEIVEEFLEGLLDAFDLDGDISDETLDDGETVEVRVEGEDLGLLIGPRGNTLQAIQDLARAALQRRSDGPLEGRLRVDVAGYRARRREALAQFARSKAEEVVADGRERALEPMSAADRKIVHDTVNELDGVSTISEGEDASRRVVIVPAE